MPFFSFFILYILSAYRLDLNYLKTENLQMWMIVDVHVVVKILKKKKKQVKWWEFGVPGHSHNWNYFLTLDTFNTFVFEYNQSTLRRWASQLSTRMPGNLCTPWELSGCSNIGVQGNVTPMAIFYILL